MRKIIHNIIICLPIVILSACDVHEWPQTPEFTKLHLRLDFETDMTEWKHLYDGGDVIEQEYGRTYDNHHEDGKIRYIVRTYPILEISVQRWTIPRSSCSLKTIQTDTIID